jgi:ABC-2 type transport system ATP-binding protein
MIISVSHLAKSFTARKVTGRKFFMPVYESKQVAAVKGISFEVAAGECVAFLGPNGAGKSTTLKMLSGILTPTGGTALVAGKIPWEERRALAHDIGLVFGQRSQLWQHLPARESFELLGTIYGLSKARYTERLGKLAEVFRLNDLLDRPVRSFSLGQRMRCEIAASLLHGPKILFLDEPTIGLDVNAKADLRRHLVRLNGEEGTTVILTSHDTDDVEAICSRVILIDKGEKLVDMPLAEMRRRYLSQKRLFFSVPDGTPLPVLPGALSVRAEDGGIAVEIDPSQTPTPRMIAEVLGQIDAHDVSVGDVPLEEVIAHVYREGAG